MLRAERIRYNTPKSEPPGSRGKNFLENQSKCDHVYMPVFLVFDHSIWPRRGYIEHGVEQPLQWFHSFTRASAWIKYLPPEKLLIWSLGFRKSFGELIDFYSLTTKLTKTTIPTANSTSNSATFNPASKATASTTATATPTTVATAKKSTTATATPTTVAAAAKPTPATVTPTAATQQHQHHQQHQEQHQHPHQQ